MSFAETKDRVERARGALEAALTPDPVGPWTPPSAETLRPLFPAYEIEALLGRGGMGAVYRARQKSLDRPVAIKLLPFELGVREDFAERFRREAAALARLSHPNIVAVHDFGQADDGHFYMVMEFVDGSDLAARLRRGRLPPDEALPIVRQVCEALAFAHEHGVVHRDIKPANILLGAAGQVKVTDFGIARMIGDEPRTPLTMTGSLLGTPDYVAPEQTRLDAAVDHRADIFSVGVMLYELLTGELPRGVFRPIGQMVPSARALDRVVTRALQQDPAKRYATVTELGRELAIPRRRRRRWLVPGLSAAGLAAFLVTLALPLLNRAWSPHSTKAKKPGEFVNSLGQRFLPSGTPGVFFCATETRVRDFAAFAKENAVASKGIMWVNFIGDQASWHPQPGSWQNPGFPQTEDHPVVGVTHDNAVAFCVWLTEKERAAGLIGGEDTYRLPTNAEWSVAVGLPADSTAPSGRYPWGAGFPPPLGAGNFPGGEITAARGTEHEALPVIPGYRDAYPFTAPVGSFPPNERGLHDLGGNAWEWTETSGYDKAWLRGASWWENTPEKLDAANRILHLRDLHTYVFGFRLALVRREAPSPR